MIASTRISFGHDSDELCESPQSNTSTRTSLSRIGTSNIQKLELLRDACDLAAQCNGTLRNVKIKTYFLEKSILRKNLLTYHESCLEKHIQRVYKFILSAFALGTFAGQDQQIADLAKTKKEAFTNLFAKFEKASCKEDPDPITCFADEAIIEPPQDQNQLLHLLRTSSGPPEKEENEEEGGKGTLRKGESKQEKRRTEAGAEKGNGVSTASRDKRTAKALVYSKWLQNMPGGFTGSDTPQRKAWDKFTLFLSAVDHFNEQVSHHEFPQEVEEGENEEKLVEVRLLRVSR